jgi:hypothetical protein
MVVATFKEGVTPNQIRELIPAEQVRAKELEDKGILGFIKVAMPKRTVFLEAFGEEEIVVKSINSLPLAVLWDLEFFETTPPAGTAS